MNTMRIIKSTWGNQKTFKLIPISLECPYNEAIYDPSTKTLAIISKDKKQSMHMLPRLDDAGDVEYLKIKKRENGKNYKEERKILETFYEYYIEDREDIESFLATTAVNYGTFDVNVYLDNDKKSSDSDSEILTSSSI